jgi:hypothetical protein
LDVGKAAQLSNWVWRNLSPSPLEWAKSLSNSMNTSESFAHYHSFLLKPMALAPERYESFLNWLEDDVFAPLQPANSDLLDSIADVAIRDIKQLVEDVCNEKSQLDS